ncbi:MAG: GTPase/DUF3482 domain-containing protein [Bradymonadales bacterium]|nr:GTPase/DUF3482 domain-containing protein [Bradymonadales bacterium]
MSQPPPVFAVVGHVNKGKSSIVSTLAEDPEVAIDTYPGTTQACRQYPIAVDGQDLFILVDTPGFEQAREFLSRLRQLEEGGSSRRQAVGQLVAGCRGSGEFEQECELLSPVIQGAGILYVVDGSQPFRRQYRAEMEILQWTGQPRMALINTISDKDHIAEWNQELDQFFSIVRAFDAHKVGFVERIRLLRGMRELREDWRAPLDEAIEHLVNDWRQRRQAVTRVIVDLLLDQLTFVLEETVSEQDVTTDHGERLVTRFHQALRDQEHEARRFVEKLYKHDDLKREETAIEPPVWERDLFAEASWKILGLTAGQLLWTGVTAGAVTGGAIDAAVGGTSFLTGTLIGALAGGATSLRYASRRLASPRNVLRSLSGHKLVRIGPHKNPNFPWIVLDRALLHWLTIRDWAHARRETVHLDHDPQNPGLVANLEDSDRKQLARLFKRIHKKGKKADAETRAELETILSGILESLSKQEEAALAAG